jgi:purine nucleoside phosphorylase
MGFDVTRTTGQISAFVRQWRKKWGYNEKAHQLFIDFKKTYDSVRNEVLYNILAEFDITMKLVRLIKTSLNEPLSGTSAASQHYNHLHVRHGITRQTPPHRPPITTEDSIHHLSPTAQTPMP